MTTQTQINECHRRRHLSLHASVNELMSDIVAETGLGLGQLTLIEFLRWSYANTVEPTNDAVWRHPSNPKRIDLSRAAKEVQRFKADLNKLTPTKTRGQKAIDNGQKDRTKSNQSKDRLPGSGG